MDQSPAPEWARRARARAADPWAGENAARPPRLVIVGPCASGKSTLAAALAADGYEVHVSAQEHSETAYLWALPEPDFLLYLSVDLAGVRRRRGDAGWPDAIYGRQVRRLQPALARCDIYLDTSGRGPAEVRAAARAALRAAGAPPPNEAT
jgi:hypothetical protein